jgi:hypothetical protein
MADTLVERLEGEAAFRYQMEPSISRLLKEAADRIGLLTRSLEVLTKALGEAQESRKPVSANPLTNYLDNKFGVGK